MRIAGLDIGTTGCKLTVFDGSGRYLDSAYASYPSSRGSGGHEMDAEALMDGVFSVMEAAGRKYPDIGGIGVTSFGETFVLTDRAGVPLHRVMLSVHIPIQILLPGGTVETEVDSQVCLAESIIVGGVPGTFIQVDQ